MRYAMKNYFVALAFTALFREFLVADPTVIRAEDGNFYLYATESGKNNIPILRSSDLVNWTKVG